MVSEEAMARRAGDVDDASEGTVKALKKQTKQQRVRRKISLKHDSLRGSTDPYIYSGGSHRQNIPSS